MSNIFKTKLNAACIVLIPACIGINYLEQLFASVLKLPLWLDSIGTCIGAVLGGPIIGGICGAANNNLRLYNRRFHHSGLCTDQSWHRCGCRNYGKARTHGEVSGAVLTACVAGFVAVLISTPLNIIFWGGTTGKSLGRRRVCMVTGFRTSGSAGSFLDK